MTTNADIPDFYCKSSEDEDGTPTPSTGESSAAKLAYAQTYAAFDDDWKWILTSGRKVEDVLFEACCAMGKQPSTTSVMAHSWFLSLDSTEMKSWLEADEWQEIIASVPKLPKPSEEFVKSLSRFYNVHWSDSSPIAIVYRLSTPVRMGKVGTTVDLR